MALIDALDLMLESLAPSRWDIFEDDVKGIVSELGQALTEAGDKYDARVLGIEETREADDTKAEAAVVAKVEVSELQADDHNTGSGEPASHSRIDVTSASDEIEDFELEIKVKSSARKKRQEASQITQGQENQREQGSHQYQWF